MNTAPFPRLVLLLVAFFLATGAAVTTFRVLPVGCSLVSVLHESTQDNRNQDGYSYHVQMQGSYNPIRFCEQMRVLVTISIPPLSFFPPAGDVLSVQALTLQGNDQQEAHLPVQRFPARSERAEIILIVPWLSISCGRVRLSTASYWSAATITTPLVCGEV